MNYALRIAAAASLLAVAIPCCAKPAPDGSAIGLWAWRTSYSTGPKGELALTRRGTHWHAELAGAAADGTETGNAIRIDFPSDGGSFRGTLDRGVLHGFWIRRAVPEDPRFAAGESLAYTGPLALRPAGPDRWRATVTPLPDTFTLYLKIFRDTDGVLKAAFRNPETNSHGAAMQFTATQDGDALHFSAQPDPAKPPERLDAKLLHDPDRIGIYWSGLNATIELTRSATQDAVSFFPRLPDAAPYVYHEPPATRDGWTVARARDVGMDEAALARVVQRIATIDPASAKAWLIHSVAVAYRGKLVLDEYFYGYGRDEPHDTRSAGKTFSAVILGALQLEGRKLSVDTKLYDLMAPLGPFVNPDPRKGKITLGHVLTHTAGFACDDNADTSPGNEDMIEADRAHPDWTKVTLDLPMQYEPGAHYAYCSMNINLAGAALSRATGEWLPELFDRTIARPLQFGPYYWNLQGNGEGYLGGGAFVRSRDFLKIGQGYLDGGIWNGHRIATPDWARISTSEQTHVSPATTGRAGDAFRSVYYDTGEGYAWHLLKMKSGGRSYDEYHANGNGGQLLIVVPKFDLAVVFTAGNYGQGVWNRERDDIVGGMIIPAILHPPVE